MENYYLGLDIGTNSVGWAVTDVRYNLIKAPVKGKYKNHDMWGIRLFEAAETAKKRRVNRNTRRRLSRKKDRIRLLQAIFAEEMRKVDDTFFIRLNESRLQKKDRKTEWIHPLFSGENYTDKEYYEDFPSIFHLRKELIYNPEAHDIRMVYLALHNIIKYRGNFLLNGEVSVQQQKNIKNAFEKMALAFDQYGLYLRCRDTAELETILLDKSISRTEKANQIKEIIEIEDKDGALKFNEKKAAKVISLLLVGNCGNIKDLFPAFLEEKFDKDTQSLLKIKFTESKYEETQKDELQEKFPNEMNVIDAVKTFYDWSIFVGIMGEHIYISDAKVEAYEKHQKNLCCLKKLLKKYLTQKEYREFFHSKTDKSKTYAAYVGMSGKMKKPIKCIGETDFYCELQKKLDRISNKIEICDQELFETCRKGVAQTDFLPVLRNKDNGVIPRQIHELELKKILENASAYLPFLNQVDEKYNKTNIEKIISIFEFRVPYYVGPLSTRHQKQAGKRNNTGANVWVQRKEGMENERVYPWNFDQVIDREKSNDAFIRRMTNKCTYLVGEDVLPKNSLLYQKFMVLNELNNLKIKGEKISVALKKELYQELFEKEKKVKGKRLVEYLNKNYGMGLVESDISGIDQDFTAALTTEILFKNIFKNNSLTDQQKDMVEDVVRWKTIYGDDKKMLRKVIEKQYPELPKEKVKEICSLPKMSKWGNFSKQFLTQVFCEEMFCVETGEMLSILSAMWHTNENLMQLLSSRFGYKEKIEEINARRRCEITNISYETCVEELFTSPSNKRAIWQTLQIVEEVKKIMGAEPKKIFIEMARGGKKKGEKIKSRKNYIEDLYKNCKKDTCEWYDSTLAETLNTQSDRALRSKKLYLYYMQQGRCAYTGEKIDLSELMENNTKWDIDHIFPQSKIKDDSFDNLVLVKKGENAKKSNELINESIQNKMCDMWKCWHEHKFISREKYHRLMKKGEFTNEELSGFIARQLVETRQASKLVADVLQQTCKNSKIIYVKANLVSGFRQKPLDMLKCRKVNDYHHAKDAYLNIVVGDVYNTKYTDNPYQWIEKNRDTNYSITKTMYWDVKNNKGGTVWKGCDKQYNTDAKGKTKVDYVRNEKGEITGGDIDRIREILRRETCLYTEYVYCEKGKLFDVMQERKNAKGAKIPLKKELEISEYGGYKSANSSYFALIEFEKKGKKVKHIVGVPIYISNMLEHNKNAFLEYCENQLGYEKVNVLKPMIKKNSLLSVDGFPMRIRGESGADCLFKGNLQLKVDEDNEETIRLIEKYLEKVSEDEELDVSERYDQLSEEKLVALYDKFIEKLEKQYKKRPANQWQTLVSRRETFIGLSLKDKADVLNQILQMFRCDGSNTSSNLEKINEGSSKGRICKNKNTLFDNKITLIHQSVTGLFENRERL